MTWTVLPAPPPKKQSVLQSLLGGLAQGAVNAGQQLAANKKEEDTKQKRQNLFKSLGLDTQGENDPNVLKMLLENQQNQQKVKAKEAENNEILAGVEEQNGLPPGALKKFRSNPALAATLTKPKSEKNPLGGLSGVPTTPEDAAKIEQIINENPKARADQLTSMFQKAGLKSHDYNPYIESRRRSDETTSKNDVEREKTERKEKLAFHKESEKYDTELRESATRAQKQLQVSEDIDKAINSGNVKPKSLANFFKTFGHKGEALANAFLNGDQATIAASSPLLLEGWKDVFGVRLSDTDVGILKDTIPSIGKTPEANKVIMGLIKKYAKMAINKQQIASKIKEKNKSLRPLGYADLVEKEFNKSLDTVGILTPDGKRRKVRRDQLQKYLDAGATLS